MTISFGTLARPLQWLFWAGLAVYLATLPVPHTIALRNLALAVMLAITLAALIKYRVAPEFPLALAWGAYALVALISVLYAVDPEYSRRNFIAEFVYGILVLMVGATWGFRKPMLGGLLALVVILNITWLSITLFDYPFSEFGNALGSAMSLPPLATAGINSNVLITIMPLLGLAIWRSRRAGRGKLAALLVMLFLLDLGALVLSGNRQGVIATAAGLLCVAALLPRAAFTRRRLAVFLVLMAFVAGLAALQIIRRAPENPDLAASVQSSLAEDLRWDLWQFSIEKIIEQPWRGGGFGRRAFDKLYADYRPDLPILWHAHNMVLNKGIQMGIPGILAFIWLWIALIRKLRPYLRGDPEQGAIAVTALAIVVAVAMKNMSDDFFFRDPALLFWLLMGFLLGELKRGSGNTA